MGDQSKRPGCAGTDVHATIKAQCEELRRARSFGVRHAETLPEVAALLLAARRRVESAMPSTVIFEGRTYWLRTRLSVQYDLFDSPTAPEPMLCGASLSRDDLGHTPGH